MFTEQRDRLEQYFVENRARSSRELLFYVRQGGRLQCLNGGYLSQVSERLGDILLGPTFSGRSNERRPVAVSTATGEVIASIRLRIGQNAFSSNVRQNYGGVCCFPACEVNDSAFLVGAHIDRWADREELRGDTANGLCLCLMHDTAFEFGLFTLDSESRVRVNTQGIAQKPWVVRHLVPHDHGRIRPADVPPSFDALKQHWMRIGFSPA